MPYGSSVTWRFVTPENVQEVLLGGKNSLETQWLKLPSVQEEASGHYICNWTYNNEFQAVGSVTTLEVIHTGDLHVVSWWKAHSEALPCNRSCA